MCRPFNRHGGSTGTVKQAAYRIVRGTILTTTSSDLVPSPPRCAPARLPLCSRGALRNAFSFLLVPRFRCIGETATPRGHTVVADKAACNEKDSAPIRGRWVRVHKSQRVSYQRLWALGISKHETGVLEFAKPHKILRQHLMLRLNGQHIA
ncbi:unnamed protein product [Sphacelaria rigidula]